MFKKIPVIALEEHYWDHELAAQLQGAEGTRSADMLQRLYDLGDLRLREMDEAGIDIQVLSHGAPSAQKLDASIAVDLTRRVNDRLAEAVAFFVSETVAARPAAGAGRDVRPAIQTGLPAYS